MQKWAGLATSVINRIEYLATVVYHEACAAAADQPAARGGWLNRLVGRKPKLIDPERFHFY
jgi:hypothetical protein